MMRKDSSQDAGLTNERKKMKENRKKETPPSRRRYQQKHEAPPGTTRKKEPKKAVQWNQKGCGSNHQPCLHTYNYTIAIQIMMISLFFSIFGSASWVVHCKQEEEGKQVFFGRISFFFYVWYVVMDSIRRAQDHLVSQERCPIYRWRRRSVDAGS